MPLREFRDILARLDEATDIWLAQCAPRWATDDHWIALRDRIDDALFERLVLGHALEVHRIVLYDLPEGLREGAAGDRHRRWVARLRRDQRYLGAHRNVVYEVRQIVLATEGPESRPPRDLAAIDVEDGFAALAGRSSFAVKPTEIDAGGPYADQDPLFYLDLDVPDTDRLQIGPEQRRRRRFAGEAEPEG